MPRLEHIGLAVNDPDAVAALFETLLGVRPYKQESVEREGVRTHFISAETAKLELLEALGPDSPVAKYLDKRGEGLHHLAFEVEDIHAQMERLRAAGFTPLSDAPRPGADGKLIFFLHPKQTHGVLVELCQSAPTPFASVAVPYRDGRLAVYPRGDDANPPLVVLHGFGGSVRLDAEALVRRLEPHYHLLGIDLAGHGGSDTYADTDFSLGFFADNVRAVLDHVDVEKAHVFGFALGGLVALRLALDHAERIDRLAVHAARTTWDDESIAALTVRFNTERLADQPAVVDRLNEVHRDWRRLYARTASFARALPGEARLNLGQVVHPTLVTAADEDPVVPLEATLGLYHALPDARLGLLPGTAHALPDTPFLSDLLRQHVEASANDHSPE